MREAVRIPGPHRGRRRSALAAYLCQVEPLRLAVNRLLEAADPILSGNHDGTLSPARPAARRPWRDQAVAARQLKPKNGGYAY